MPNVVLCGYYGQGNAGDEALLLTLLQMLPPGVTPIVLSHNPTATTQAYGVTAIPHKSWATLKAIAKADGFIFGGGSLLQDVTSLGSLLYYAGLMKWAQLLGKKTIAWGQGIGPLQSSLANQITRFVLRGCTEITVRDQASADLLKNWQISHRLAPDPVWALAAKSFLEMPDLPRPRIAINLRSHRTLTPPKIAVLGEALKQFQRQHQASVILVPFQKSQDEAIAKQLYDELAEPKAIIAPLQPQQYKSLFAQVDFLIGMRLHSLILAAAACPCFALSYDPKVAQLQQQCHLPGLDLDQLPRDATEITEQWTAALQTAEKLTPTQQQTIQSQVQTHQEILTIFL
ncbi:polysaccharide pyruvyl transferase CsaB [Picosynechococcus sp. PCC 73109]|uniref:polysaccharide pyruvyl transferase CsaB n=1 Tax=Picosynechococcus sp. PCC 73109 TaxID=374982 RepID=UPI00074591DC|nr:polysaccharide pyruvyl transferase CsaB [Picosynechococcus sp. PCC 73109]AMA07856.1 polysaccharide pyruvyl transferase CsaB [Picosynechococcus sp. PCC 73109]